MEKLITNSNFILLFSGIALIMTTVKTSAYESMYERTPTGKIEIKTLPERITIKTSGTGSYFDNDNRLFSILFNYIKDNKVAMTVPVEVEVDNPEMRFFAGGKDAQRTLKNNEQVSVEILLGRKVVSMGLSGSYTQARFEKGRDALKAWLNNQTEYEAAGPAYIVYWHGPYVPGFFKKSEVHLPLTVTGIRDSKSESVPKHEEDRP